MAASIAAHGLLLLSLQASPPVSLPSPQGAAFQVQLLAPAAPPKKMTVVKHAPVQPEAVPQSVSHRLGPKKREFAKRADAAIVASPMPAKKKGDQAKRVMVAVNQPAHVISAKAPTALSEAASKARESRVRNHLERYKYYPASARQRGIEGEVELDFALNEQGLAQALSIISGSGYAVLDDAALQTVQRAQPFPASGGEYRFRLRFSRL